MTQLICFGNIIYIFLIYPVLKLKSFRNITVETWCNPHFCSVLSGTYICLQVIWCNSNIHIGNKQVFWDNFGHAGVIYISGLLDDNPKLKSIEKLNLEFDINMNFPVVSTEISNSDKLVDSCR